MSWLSNIDKKQLALHVFFICLVGVVSAFTSIVLCICVNTSYRLNQEYSWLVFLLPVLGIVTLAFYKAMKLSYFYSTDDMVMEMRENKPVSPTLAPAILVGTCLSTLGGGAVGKESSAFQMGSSIGETLSRAFKLKNVFKDKQDRNVYGYAALMGMSATFSALFFAPLGAVFLVFELTHFKTFSPARFIALLVSAFIAASIAYPFGIGDIIPRVAVPGVTPDLMLQVVLIGTLGGILGRFFGASLAAVRAWERKRLNHPYLSVFVVGIGITILVVGFWPAELRRRRHESPETSCIGIDRYVGFRHQSGARIPCARLGLQGRRDHAYPRYRRFARVFARAAHQCRSRIRDRYRGHDVLRRHDALPYRCLLPWL